MYIEKDEQGRIKLERRVITEFDCCPICQEEMLKTKLSVTHCK